MSARDLPAGQADAYLQFLRDKIKMARFAGFEVDPGEVNPALKPHTQDIVRWAALGGRRAVFAKFGLHKTVTALEWMRLIGVHRPGLRLNVCPLGVRQEFILQAAEHFRGAYALDLRFISRDSEIGDERTIYLTNFEPVREGKISPGLFRATNLDEASILRSFGSKTYQEFLPAFEPVEFKLVSTATPSPNRLKELIHYAGYLGIMDTGQALTRFFQRNSEKAGDLTLYPHKEQEFWLWVASWAIFLQRPSDLGHSDEGYALPALDVMHHEVPSDYAKAGHERNGQALMFTDPALGLAAAAGEKRESLTARVAEMMKIVDAHRAATDPADQIVLWCDLNAEQDAIEAGLAERGLTFSSVHGSLTTDEVETRVGAWRAGKTYALVGKPVMLGQGLNLQQANTAVFVGCTYKFNDLIQAVHRIQRFGQKRACTAHIVHSEAEREVLRTLRAKWTQHDEMVNKMSELIRKFGLNHLAMQETLARTIGVERIEVTSDLFHVANNDCVDEARRRPDNSVDLIVTSIPFANHYEYSPSYNDFGHTEDNRHFWKQMDFLTPELLRILKPGRIAAIHVKDRINFGNVTGKGLPTSSPFHAEAIAHFSGMPEFDIKGHGFDYCGMVTVSTDVVRENNGTYRLSFTEMGKDSTKMGVGSPEYIILLHKPQTDRSKGYADERVTKVFPDCLDDDGNVVPYDRDLRPVPGTGYSLARWQIDAHAFWRSSGNRLMTAEEMAALGPDRLASLFTKFSLGNVYDHEFHVRIGEELALRGALPSTFMSLAPGSNDPMVWHDVTRMLTLNSDQSKRAVEKHVCPLQFDIVDRLIRRFSNVGELVYDPFCGLGTVPYRAILQGRLGGGSELNAGYFMDQVHYLRAAEQKVTMPSLFDAIDDVNVVELAPA